MRKNVILRDAVFSFKGYIMPVLILCINPHQQLIIILKKIRFFRNKILNLKPFSTNNKNDISYNTRYRNCFESYTFKCSHYQSETKYKSSTQYLKNII